MTGAGGEQSAPEVVRVLAGSGRSGTTWVLDAIAHSNGLRTIFEPLHPIGVPAAGPYAYRYIPEDADEPAFKSFITELLNGNFRSVWTDYRIRTDRLRPSREAFSSISSVRHYRRLWVKLIRQHREYRRFVSRPNIIVKFIRAHLMLGWLRRTFDARIVFLLRHPGAVVESQLRLGDENWDPYEKLAYFRADAGLRAASGGRYDPILEDDLSPAEALTAAWCIENQRPLEDAQRNDYTIVFYERLIEAPEQEWRRIVQAFGLSEVPDMQLLARPSQQASTDWRSWPVANDYRRWIDRLSPSVSAEVDSMLRALNVTVYDIDDPQPRLAKVSPETV